MIDFIVKPLKQLVTKLNEYGIPVPIARLKGRPDVVGTMMIMSFAVALLGTIGKLTKYLGEVDLTQAVVLYTITLSAYLGNKKLTTDGKSFSSPGEDIKPIPAKETPSGTQS